MGASNGNIPLIKPINLKEKVKSSYIIKVIFSFLNEKKKLNLIIYNNIYKNKFLNI